MRGHRRFIMAILSLTYLLFSSSFVFSQNPGVLKSAVYSRLKCCACGVSFDKCICPEAKEMKAYIDAFIETGTREEEIFYKVAKRYSLSAITDERVKSDLAQRLIKEAGQERPQIILEPKSFDFGRVSRKQGRISKSFTLRNAGSATLVINNIKTTCPCASVALKVNKNKSAYFGTAGSPGDWQAAIKAKESGVLELLVDLVGPHVKAGKIIREAVVTSNDPLYPEISVMVEAEVRD